MARRKSAENEMRVWKFGCNWGGRQNPNFYEYIKAEKIVIGRERFRYSKGDLVLITEGFTVRAIAKVREEPHPIIDNPAYIGLSENYNVTWDELTILAKAEWYELSKDEIFQYLVQRGSGRVRKPEIKEKAVELWSNRNRQNS